MKYQVYHRRQAGPARQVTHTFEEAVAWVRSWLEEGAHSWQDFEIRHEDGRRWWWTLQGKHGIIHAGKVDN